MGAKVIKLIHAQQDSGGQENVPISASVKVEYKGNILEESAVGDLIVMEMFNTVRRLLLNTEIAFQSATGSFNSQDFVFNLIISVSIDAVVYEGRGENIDLAVALAFAMVDVINFYLISKSQETRQYCE